MPEVTGRLRDLALDQVEERRVVGRQHIGEAEVLAAPRPARLLRRAEFGYDLQHPLHGLGIDSGAPVQDPIDRGRADAGLAGDVGDGGCGIHAWRRSNPKALMSSR